MKIVICDRCGETIKVRNHLKVADFDFCPTCGEAIKKLINEQLIDVPKLLEKRPTKKVWTLQ